MELVYLWVEEYKNIKKQGFNFSPRFKCEFKDEYDDEGKLKDNCELIIKEKKDYVSIFPENINITAIVGENGSGKSSIGKFISNFYDNYNIYHSIDGCGSDKFLMLHISKSNEKFILSNIKGIYSKYNLNSLKDKNLFSNILNVSRDNIHNKIDEDFRLSSLKNHIKYMRFFLKNFTVESKGTSFLGISGLEPQLLWNEEINRIKKLSSCGYEDFLCLILLNNINDTFDTEKIKNIQNIKEELKKLKMYLPSEDEYNYFTGNIIEIDSLDTLNIKKYKDYFNYFFLNEKEVFIDEYSDGEFVKFYLNLELNKYLSYGNNVFTLIFDEIESSLHPNWQKSYIKETIETIQQTECFYHLIFITHSPFILSDIPKENVIFLEKGKQVYPFEDNQQTFGANIHTLLSHGFFMKDGLMGEFAKDKIDTVIKYLNQTKLSDDEIIYCENIISIIGEPIIKRQLQKMLDSKRLCEIDVIKKQIEELQIELAKKENKK